MDDKRKIRVLLVDNDQQTLEALKESLSKHNKPTVSDLKFITPDTELEYLAAHDTLDAINTLIDEKPHICLVKVTVTTPYSYTSLKDEPGVLLINRFKKINPSIKCVAHCQGTPERKLYYLLKELNADDCIPYHATTGFVAKKLHVMAWEYGLAKNP
jgi:DNA-binding NarL/FixJ family response regulator